VQELLALAILMTLARSHYRHHFQFPVVLFVVPGPPLLYLKKWVVGVDDALVGGGGAAVGEVVVAVVYFVVVLLVTVAWVEVVVVVVVGLRQ
jgi:hypothetical protein